MGGCHVCECLLAWNRQGIMNERLDAVRRKLPLKSVSIRNADDKQMIHVPAIALGRNIYGEASEAHSVASGKLASS